MKRVLIVVVIATLVAIVALPLWMKRDLIPFDAHAREQAPYQHILLEDGYVHYRRLGVRGGQPVILVHGLSTPLFSWDGIVDGLADAGMDVIAYDLYGRGWSDRPELTNDLDLFDRQLDQLITALELEGPVDLLGISLGCLISGVYAERHPGNVRKLGLVSPGGYVADFPLAIQAMRTPVLGGWLMDVFGKDSMVSGVSEFDFPDSPVPDLVERYEEMVGYEGFLSSISSTFLNFDLDAATASYSAVGRSEIPVLAIWGTADQNTPFESSKLLQRDIPQVTVYPIEGGTHGIPLSHSAEVTEVLVEFLRE